MNRYFYEIKVTARLMRTRKGISPACVKKSERIVRVDKDLVDAAIIGGFSFLMWETEKLPSEVVGNLLSDES